MNRRVGVAAVFAVIVLISSILIARPSNTIPTLDGTLIYHRYSSYDSWDATLWMVDLPTGKQTQVSGGWKGMVSPINAHFSENGRTITFMGSNSELSEKDWDVFISTWNGRFWDEPKNLTGPNGARDEDPKFAPDGRSIIYKEDGVLSKVTLKGHDSIRIEGAPSNSSMPFYSTDGKTILFENNGDIYTLRNGVISKMRAGRGESSYYPIALDNHSFLYTRVQNNGHDAIYKGFFDRRPSIRYFFNSTHWDTSDSYPIGQGRRFILYVSGNFLIPHGGYNLMVADLKNNRSFDLDELYRSVRSSDLNTDLEELGPTWTDVRFKQR